MENKPWYIKVVTPLIKLFKWLSLSTDNSGEGPSGRKLTAITIMALIIHGHMKYVDKDNFYNVLIVYVVFVCVLLGIVTVEQIIKFLSNKQESKLPGE